MPVDISYMDHLNSRGLELIDRFFRNEKMSNGELEELADLVKKAKENRDSDSSDSSDDLG